MLEKLVMAEKYCELDDLRLCYFEKGQAVVGQPTYFLVHATGFHARCWDQTIANMDAKAHVIALDCRGHGRSDNDPPIAWEQFGRDVAAFISELDLTDLVGVGHSMGGHAQIQAAAAHPDRYRRLVLVDPVVMAPESYGAEGTHHAAWLNDAGEHPVARRKNRFATVAAMVENLHGRGSYAAWQDQVLDDYCRYGLLPDPEAGDLQLACPPKLEAEIYMGSTSFSVYPLLDRVTMPVRVIRARPRDPSVTRLDFSTSPTWDGLAGRFPDAEDIFLPEMTHFIPMQDPALTAELILRDAAGTAARLQQR